MWALKMWKVKSEIRKRFNNGKASAASQSSAETKILKCLFTKQTNQTLERGNAAFMAHLDRDRVHSTFVWISSGNIFIPRFYGDRLWRTLHTSSFYFFLPSKENNLFHCCGVNFSRGNVPSACFKSFTRSTCCSTVFIPAGDDFQRSEAGDERVGFKSILKSAGRSKDADWADGDMSATDVYLQNDVGLPLPALEAKGGHVR